MRAFYGCEVTYPFVPQHVLDATESGMKIRGNTTVDFSGSTGRCEGTAPSRFTAGISLTATQYSQQTRG